MDLSNISVNKQSSIKIAGSKVLYFDPFGVEVESHDADVIFVTHEHFDHFEPASIAKVMKDSTILVTPESMKKKVIAESGVAQDRCVFYQPGTKNELCGLSVETVPAYNKIKPFHPKLSKWQGYNVTMDGVTYYVMGDTDLVNEAKQVKCDVVLIPVGGHYTMDKKQAAEFICELKPAAVIPTHYGEVVGNPTDGRDFKALVESTDSNIQVEIKLM